MITKLNKARNTSELVKMLLGVMLGIVTVVFLFASAWYGFWKASHTWRVVNAPNPIAGVLGGIIGLVVAAFISIFILKAIWRGSGIGSLLASLVFMIAAGLTLHLFSMLFLMYLGEKLYGSYEYYGQFLGYWIWTPAFIGFVVSGVLIWFHRKNRIA